jgi:hypothetical protein
MRLIGRMTTTTGRSNHPSRFDSLKHVPIETRRLLRERLDRKLRLYRQARHVNPDLPVMSDEEMLQLLEGLEITVAADWARAEKTYAAANSSEDAKDLNALAQAGWVQRIWGRARVARDLAVAVRRAPDGPLKALRALLDHLYTQTYRGSEALRADGAVASLLAAIEAGEKDPRQLLCRTPAWVAARLWERRSVSNESVDLRRWVDLWGLLQHPALTPREVWQQADAQAFREAAFEVIASEVGLTGWRETRAMYLERISLGHGVPVAHVEPRVPPPPATLVDRALWLEDWTIKPCIFQTLESCGDIFGLLRLLLADVIAEDNSPAPHPMAVRLLNLAIERPEFLVGLLFQARAHPKLLADVLLHPPSTALACLLIAQWRSPPSAWDRVLIQRDDRVAQVDAFADAAAILGEYLRDERGAASEGAALLNWFHHSAGPEFIDDAAGSEILHGTLIRELSGVPKATLRAMVESLDGPALRRGLGASEFATVLELVDVGGLADELEPATVVDAYAQSIHSGEYNLTAHRVGAAAAAALAQLAARTAALRQGFLYPLKVSERLAAATSDDNPYTLADSIGGSIRAHIRILCRAIVGSAEEVSADLTDALVAAVKQGALDHREKNRVAAFAPRFERTITGPGRDRALAADLGAALRALSGASQGRLLEAIIETDEPLILAQLLSFSPPGLRTRITARITALAPTDAGDIRSLFEMQARIDELLTAGAADAAARYMEAETQLKTLGSAPGRELVRFQNQLRLQYLRNEWAAILSTPKPTFQSPSDQTSAEETLKLFQGVAMLKGPTPDAEAAKAVFADLFTRHPTVSLATNWFAAEISRLLKAGSFTLLKGGDIQKGRRALTELERMLLLTPAAAPSENEVIECNKALLLLAVGEPAQALAVVTAVPLVRLHDTAAAYRAVALARLGQNPEATAVLDAAEQTHGVTTVLAGARAYIASGASFGSVPSVSLQDLSRDVASAIARFRTMNPIDQARALNDRPDPFEALVVEHVRSAAASVVSLVPMMKVIKIDMIEDDITAFIQHLLEARVEFLGWSTADQSKGGFTAAGNPGYRDLVLKRGSTILALIEAVVYDQPLTHDSMRADLESHLQKLLGYGNTRLFFHLTYAYTDDPTPVMSFLEGIAESAQPPGFIYKGREPIPHTDSRPPGFVARYGGDFDELRVVFLVLNLGQPRQRAAAKSAAKTKARKSPRSKEV